MGVEDLVKRSPTCDVIINEFLDLPEGDTTKYKVVIRKLTVEEQMEIYKEYGGDEQQVSFENMVKALLHGVAEAPFDEWNEEKVRWLDKTNRDLFMAIFTEVSKFNAPLETETEPISDTPQL